MKGMKAKEAFSYISFISFIPLFPLSTYLVYTLGVSLLAGRGIICSFSEQFLVISYQICPPLPTH